MLVEIATGLGLPLGEAISGFSMAARRRAQRWAAFCCGRLVGRAPARSARRTLLAAMGRCTTPAARSVQSNSVSGG
jgi:hypothetical protein